MKLKLIYIFSFACLLAFSQVNVYVSNDVRTISGKEYYVHTVQKGQTIYSIARAYGVSLKDLLQNNPEITTNFNIGVGQELKVPTSIVNTAVKPDAPVKNEFKRHDSSRDNDNFIYYTVKRGEWAFKIVKDFNITFKDLKDNNPNVDLSNLTPGTEIMIPKNKENANRKVFASDEGFEYYSVRDGETLESIAVDKGVSYDVLLRANKNSNPKPGSIIRIPPKQGISNSSKLKYKSYMDYAVKPKETLYRISRNFQIDIDILKEINGLGEDNYIKEGQVLKIPVINSGDGNDALPQSKIKKEDKSKVLASSNEDAKKKIEPKTNSINPLESDVFFVKHEVLKGQTAYSIAKKYGVPLELLYKHNPEAKDGLSVGDIINLPVGGAELDKAQASSQDLKDKDSTLNQKKKYSVAVVLPLYLDENQKAFNTVKTSSSKAFYSKSFPFLRFYQGLTIALTDLAKKGVVADIEVFDSEDDLAKLVSSNKLKKFDLIIGPIFNAQISLVANYAKKNNIPIVSPLSATKNDIINSYSGFFQINPPVDKQLEIISSLLAENQNEKIIIVQGKDDGEDNLAANYKKYITTFKNKLNHKNYVINDLAYSANLKERIGQSLSKGKKNVVVLASKDETFVTDIIAYLNHFQDYNINLIGMQSWEKFNNNIEFDDFFKLNMTTLSLNNIAFHSQRVKTFIKKYRERYNFEPDNFSYKGYDVMYFFLNALNQYGKDFVKKVNEINNESISYGLQTDFYFVNDVKNGGYVNVSSKVIQYDKDTYSYKSTEQIKLD